MIFKLFFYLIILLELDNCKKVKPLSKTEKTVRFWNTNAKLELDAALKKNFNIKKAKNVIIFIGDGMGLPTVTGARILVNQRNVNSTLPDDGLFMESLMNTGLIKTHCVDRYVADSSSTASAIMTGVKINSEMVNISPRVLISDCKSYDKSVDDLQPISDMFHLAGRSVGLVTTARVTHATPSTVYSNSLNRYWEYKVPEECKNVEDIASQLIRKAKNYKVVLGGGTRSFLPTGNLKGKRSDGRNLLNEWKKKLNDYNARIITTGDELRKLDTSNLDYLMGIFNESHLSYDKERNSEPSLKEMTVTALSMLKKNKDGYFLMVEGGRIDHAHHDSVAIKALDETLAFDEAIKEAYKNVDLSDTLIIVTADHSHVFTIGSYAFRDEDITGKNKGYDDIVFDKKGHTSLLYSNGPGFKSPRENITKYTVKDSNYVYHSGVPLNKETHGGEDVAVYAEGPWSHLINGVHHQNYIGHLIMYSSCISNSKNKLSNIERYDLGKHCSSSVASPFIKIGKIDLLWFTIGIIFSRFMI